MRPAAKPAFDRASLAWLGTPAVAGRTKYSLAFVLTAALGFGLGALAIGAAAAHAHGGHGYYGHGYHGGHHWNYRRAYKRAARKCAYRFGWHTWRWERCMSRRGF